MLCLCISVAVTEVNVWNSNAMITSTTIFTANNYCYHAWIASYCYHACTLVTMPACTLL